MIGSFGGGGAQRLAYNLASSLREEGTPCIGIAIRCKGNFAGSGGVEIVELDARQSDGSSVVTAARRLRHEVLRRGIDTVHVHGSRSLPLCAAGLLALHGVRLHFTWHDSGSIGANSAIRRTVLRWALRRCDRIYGSSHDVLDRLGRFCRHRNMAVFRNGVPTVGSSPKNSSPPLVVWSGRLVPHKGPMEAVRAAARLRELGVGFRMVMAGDAPPRNPEYAEIVRTERSQLGLCELLDMPGWIDDTTALNERASIGVQTSLTEGLSMALLEQMMAGLCIVATDVGDTREAIIHEQTGLLVPPGDADAIVDALRRVLIDGDLRTRLGHAARERALAEFSLEAMARQAIEFYSEALGG